MLSLVEKTRLSGPYTAGSWQARGCARLLGAPAAGGRCLAQTERSSGSGSVCRASASSGAQLGGAEDPQWPPEAAAPLQAGWCVAPSEGLATPSRDRCPAARAPLRQAGRQPPAQGPLAAFFVLCVQRIQLGKCLQPGATNGTGKGLHRPPAGSDDSLD